VFGLFDKYNIAILGERDHRDTTQYDMIIKILSDPRFLEKVGNVFTFLVLPFFVWVRFFATAQAIVKTLPTHKFCLWEKFPKPFFVRFYPLGKFPKPFFVLFYPLEKDESNLLR
jgi:hypothetical protein